MANDIEKVKVSELQSSSTLSGLDTLGVQNGSSVKARIDTFVYNTVASAVSNRPTTSQMESAISSAVSNRPTTSEVNSAIDTAITDALFLGDIIESNVPMGGLD